MIIASRTRASAVAATFGIIRSNRLDSPTKSPRPSRDWVMALVALATLSCGGADVTGVPKERIKRITANFSGQAIFGVDSLQAYAAAFGVAGDSLSGRIISLSALTPAVATISAAGVIHTHSEGTAFFAAMADGFTDTLRLQVFLRRVARVTAIPDVMHLNVGDVVMTYPFVVRAYDVSGREMENVPFYYDVTNSGLSETPNRDYLLQARHVGTGVIIVTGDTATASVEVIVTAAIPP